MRDNPKLPCADRVWKDKDLVGYQLKNKINQKAPNNSFHFHNHPNFLPNILF